MDITTIEQKRDLTLQQVSELSDTQLNDFRQDFIAVVTSEMSVNLDSGDRGYFYNRIQSAETTEQAKETLSIYFTRLINDEKALRRESNQLLRVVDYDYIVRGGMDTQEMNVSFEDNGTIIVRNSFDDCCIDHRFTQDELRKDLQDETLPYAKYYQDFITACQAIPEVNAILHHAEEQRRTDPQMRMRAFRNYLGKTPS